LVGTLLFALGNGLVAVAQQSIASGVAAVVVATTSLWAVLFAAAWGTRPTRGELVGLALGLMAVILLQRGGAFAGSVAGLVAIVTAPLAWALGSIWSRRLPLPSGSMGAAVQMIGGGLAMLLISFVRSEQVGTVTPRAVAASLYLTVFGSLVAFSAYQLLLQRTRPAIATSYAFVNPVVALALGALIAAEPMSVSHVFACLLTVLAVLFVLRSRVA
jgi:drug/metabolite transporter (DMT)-like permease